MGGQFGTPMLCLVWQPTWLEKTHESLCIVGMGQQFITEHTSNVGQLTFTNIIMQLTSCEPSNLVFIQFWIISAPTRSKYKFYRLSHFNKRDPFTPILKGASLAPMILNGVAGVPFLGVRWWPWMIHKASPCWTLVAGSPANHCASQ